MSWDIKDYECYAQALLGVFQIAGKFAEWFSVEVVVGYLKIVFVFLLIILEV